jgi:hypothetical protein
MRAAWLAVLVLPVTFAFACSSPAAESGEDVETASAELSAQAKLRTATFLDRAALAWVGKTDWGFVQGGRCVMSCHTTVPFMMVRSKLPDASTASTNALATVRGYVEARVNAWATAAPLYSWVASDSRGLEAILNAFALVAADAPSGALSATAKTALAAMWAEQKSDGSFPWWSTFTLAPWENAESGLWGAALADVAIGMAPPSYVTGMTKMETTKLASLEAYLRASASTSTPALHNRAMVLVAASRRPTLLPSATKTQIADAIRALQATDGSFSASSLGFTVSGGATAGAAPHAYATAFYTWVLAQSGDAADTLRVTRGRAWLEAHQGIDGSWAAKSLNKPTTAWNNQLMTEAATAYAALALVP